MSSSTPEALSPPSSPPTTGRPRPPRYLVRSVSEIPPSPARLQAGALKTGTGGGGQLAQQAFMQRNRTSVDVSAPEVLSARSSPGTSRRASMLMAGPGVDGASAGGLSGSRKASDETGGDVERKNIAKTVTGLKQTMVDLGDLSSETTRLLDDTYSSVLEKMGVLQSTILGLKELALQSRDVSESFGREAAEVRDEVDAQIREFNDFQAHEERIRVLRTRVDVSHDKVSSLGRRVDVVRDMVEGWERADREWQERTRRRLMVIWGITSAIVSVLVLLYYGAQYRGSGGGLSVDEVRGGEGIEGALSGSLNASSAEIPVIDVEAGERFPGIKRRESKGGDKDERLRLFDEL